MVKNDIKITIRDSGFQKPQAFWKNDINCFITSERNIHIHLKNGMSYSFYWDSQYKSRFKDYIKLLNRYNIPWITELEYEAKRRRTAP